LRPSRNANKGDPPDDDDDDEESDSSGRRRRRRKSEKARVAETTIVKYKEAEEIKVAGWPTAA
jgi:hypothetical protein